MTFKVNEAGRLGSEGVFLCVCGVTEGAFMSASVCVFVFYGKIS